METEQHTNSKYTALKRLTLFFEMTGQKYLIAFIRTGIEGVQKQNNGHTRQYNRIYNFKTLLGF